MYAGGTAPPPLRTPPFMDLGLARSSSTSQGSVSSGGNNAFLEGMITSLQRTSSIGSTSSGGSLPAAYSGTKRTGGDAPPRHNKGSGQKVGSSTSSASGAKVQPILLPQEAQDLRQEPLVQAQDPSQPLLHLQVHEPPRPLNPRRALILSTTTRALAGTANQLTAPERRSIADQIRSSASKDTTSTSCAVERPCCSFISRLRLFIFYLFSTSSIHAFSTFYVVSDHNSAN